MNKLDRYYFYPCLDAGQRRPLQALNSRSVGDDDHDLCRAGWTFGLLYQCLQVGACDRHTRGCLRQIVKKKLVRTLVIHF